jgi:hypothetical protein
VRAWAGCKHADRARVLDGLPAARGSESVAGDEPRHTLQRLAPRWFVARNAHATAPPVLMNPRHAMSFMRGAMTRVEIRVARGVKPAAPSAALMRGGAP